MDNHIQKPEAHCRICGNSKFNKYQYAADTWKKVELGQLFRQDGSLDHLIRPCECRGEFAYAHQICLADWLETTQHEHCDVCRFKYNIRYIERSIFDWLFESQQLWLSLRVFGLALLVYYLSALGILVGRSENKQSILNVFVERTAVVWIIICTIGVITYSYQSFRKFKSWKNLNRRVLVEENMNPQLNVETKPKDVLKSSGFKPHYD